MQTIISNALVLGVNGNVGTLLSNKLSECGVSVTGIDLHPEASHMVNCCKYISLDILDKIKVKEKNSFLINSFDCIIICLPEETAILSLSVLLKEMSSGTLLLDTLSVKSNFVRAFTENMNRTHKSVEMISLNPMFSPSLGFQGNNVAVIKVKDGPLSDRFVSFLKEWGSNIFFMTPEYHDECTSVIQVATHAIIISFGLVLRKMDYDISKAKKISTPPHDLLLSLLSRLLTAKAQVYWDIQISNPYAQQARQAILDSIIDLDKVINSKNYAEFEYLLEGVMDIIKPEINQLSENCASLIESQRGKRNS